MLFNSLIYLCLFLPVVAIVFYLLRKMRLERMGNVWLVLASLFFYSYWVPEYLPLILLSIIVNFTVNRFLLTLITPLWRKLSLFAAIVFNVGLLGYYKYSDFFIENISIMLDIENPQLLNLALPIGISFFTFQQIAFVVDSYKFNLKEYDFINYSLFVSFFPQLIAGPIVHHKEMMPQFDLKQNKGINWENVYLGLFLLSLGLFKKLAIADSFAVWADQGFTKTEQLHFWTAWRTSLSYSVQLYFDFSGYTDMALGSARLFNIKLPINFASPYQALDIQDFWRRWHITLGRFLREYIYIPLGGSKNGMLLTCCNLFLTFLIGGIWHGAGWTFIVWGALHGGAMVVHRLWKNSALQLPRPAAWFITMMFINVAWVYFRAPDLSSANTILAAMMFVDASLFIEITGYFNSALFNTPWWIPLLFLFVLQDICYRNSQAWAEVCQPNLVYTFASICMLGAGSALLMNQNRFSEFLYFQF